MELQAAIEALSALRQPCTVEFFTDSKYVQNGVSAWMFGWKKNGWKTKAGQPVKNADLWRALDAATSRHRVSWRWLKGHAGHPENERCDGLANGAIDKIQREFSRDQLGTHLREFTAAQGAAPSPDLL